MNYKLMIRTKKVLIDLCLLTGFVLLIIFHGCKTEKYNFLASEDLKWMVYAEGDSLKFKSTTGQLKTYLVPKLYRAC